MNKYPLIGGSICAMVLIILASMNNIVGYQTVQASSQSVISNEIDSKELLFQTITDITNNKEIQRIILKSQINRGIFLTSDIPVVTKNQLRQMYFIGLILSKVISKSRMQSMVGKYQFNNQEMQKEISAVMEKETTFNAEINQLSSLNCDCDTSDYKEKGIPKNLCMILLCIIMVLVAPVDFLSMLFENMPLIRLIIAITIGLPLALISICIILLMALLNCWGNIPP
jgi:hypothetical protein